MKWFVIRCPRCGWVSSLVEEYVAKKFEGLRVCQDCKAQGVDIPYQIQEKATFTRKRTR